MTFFKLCENILYQ